MYLDENNVPLSTSLGYVVGLTLIMLVVCTAAYRYVWPTVINIYFTCAKALYWTMRTWRTNLRGGTHYHHATPIRTHCKKGK